MPEPRRFRTVREFERLVDGYFEACKAESLYPDEAGLILHLGLDREEYERYLGGAEGKGYAACLRRARLRRESIIVRGIYGAEKAAAGKIFLARQTGNGGLTDRPRDGQEKMAVELKLGGAGPDPFG